MTSQSGPNPICPPGLQYLLPLNYVFIKQHIELFEIITDITTQNTYSLKNHLGEKIYFAAEESECCARYWCESLRPFGMQILDPFNNEVIHLYRPLACDSCCFPCCLQKIEVFAPPGTLVGTVEEEWTFCLPRFRVKDGVGNIVLRIEGPCWMCSCGQDIDFLVVSPDRKTTVGKISRKWPGLVRELFTDADFFGVEFPLDLDVRMKAVMLGATFLIDYMFFENKGYASNQNRNTFRWF